MVVNLSLFDAPTLAAEAVTASSSIERSADVLRRIIHHSTGPFVILRCMTDEERKNSKADYHALVTGTFSYVVLRDGRVFRELTETGEWRPTKVTRDEIDAKVKAGEWREVAP